MAPRVPIASRRPPRPSFTRHARGGSPAARLRAPGPRKRGVAAFVHSAFWRAARAARRPTSGRCLAPSSARRRRRTCRLSASGRARTSACGAGAIGSRVRRSRRRDLPLTPIDAYRAGRSRAVASRLARARRAIARSAVAAATTCVRAAVDPTAAICWPLVAAELDGIALLQFPWSARAMDEAGAALDRLAPDVVVTYAEAGGWGRALVLECAPPRDSRRGTAARLHLSPLAELPARGRTRSCRGRQPADSRLPLSRSRRCCSTTFAREHLEREGHFPSHRLAVTGSSRLDTIVARRAR